LVHTRALTSGGKVNVSIKPASLAHTRAIGGVKLTETFYPASLVHGRSFNTGTKIAVSIKTASLAHTRALGSPVAQVANQINPSSLVHTRSLNIGGKLNIKIYVGSLAHTRALGSNTVTWVPTPATIIQWSYGAFKTGMFTKQVVHR